MQDHADCQAMTEGKCAQLAEAEECLAEARRDAERLSAQQAAAQAEAAALRQQCATLEAELVLVRQEQQHRLHGAPDGSLAPKAGFVLPQLVCVAGCLSGIPPSVLLVYTRFGATCVKPAIPNQTAVAEISNVFPSP